MKTEALELWDRSKHDLGSYADDWIEMRNAVADAAYTYARAARAYDDADADVVPRAAVAARAAASYALADAVSAAAVAAVAAVAVAPAVAPAVASPYALADADYWFKRADKKMEALR